jgi:TRAP transporter TAXI family solute receptor
MKRYVLKIVFVVIFAGIMFVSSQAEPMADENIGMVTGSTTGTYIQFGKQIGEVARTVGLNITVKPSEGSLDNIKRMLSHENAGLGIVQSDVLGFMQTASDPIMRRFAGKLRLVFPFYNEEVHLFANRGIKRFADLNGKRVVVGTRGSGNWLTSTNLMRSTGIKPRKTITDLKPSEAVHAVLMGEADAMFYVAGKPVKLFSLLEKDVIDPKFLPLVDKVHFVPLHIQQMPEVYVSSVISSDDYSWFGNTISTIAVKAVLISYDFSSRYNYYYDMRCSQLSRLGQALRDNIDKLKRNGHRKWKEVDLDEKLGIWPLDTCSRGSYTERGISGELLEYLKGKK